MPTQPGIIESPVRSPLQSLHARFAGLRTLENSIETVGRLTREVQALAG